MLPVVTQAAEVAVVLMAAEVRATELKEPEEITTGCQRQ